MMPVIPDSRVGDRFVAVFMTVTLVLFAALVGLIVYLVIRVSNVQGDQHNATISSCQQSNASRTEDIEIWEAVLKLPPDATAAQKATVARDLAMVHKAFILRNCAAAAG
jgi:hypothetical protein